MAHFTMPAHTFFGGEALKQASELFCGYGKKALIVTGKHVGSSPMMEQLQEALQSHGTACAVFDGITGEPTDTMIDRGLTAYRSEGCDFVIGIGGGSPLDSAKAIAAMSVNPGKIADYSGKEIGGDLPGIVAIPTTAGTGSEATKFMVITDEKQNIKMLLRGEKLLPDVAVIDPDYTIDLPRSVTVATGLDALTHAIEAYTSKKAFPLTDMFAVTAVKRIMRSLPVAYANGYNKEARAEMAEAAFEAGICINNSSVTIVHGMSRPIGALFHVTHGISNAMLLVECLRFAMEGTPERFGDLGRAIGAAPAKADDRTAGECFLSAVEELCRSCGVPTLRGYGIDPEAFTAAIDKMAHDAIASGSPANTWRPVTEEDCKVIYRRLIAL
jgi:alcohol dehydrogenase class IV